MVPAPGARPMQVKGTETFRTVFGGTVLHGRSEGEVEGVPGKCVGEVFRAGDPDCEASTASMSAALAR